MEGVHQIVTVSQYILNVIILFYCWILLYDFIFNSGIYCVFSFYYSLYGNTRMYIAFEFTGLKNLSHTHELHAWVLLDSHIFCKSFASHSLHVTVFNSDGNSSA